MATGGGGSRPISLSSEPFYDFPCSNCAKDDKHTDGESFCVECNEIFCTLCLVHHNKIAAMRQHELLAKTKMATRKPPQDLLQMSTSRCKIHPDQVINLYCGKDDVVCCTVCIAEDHRNCEGVIYIPKKAKNIKTSQEFQDVNAAIETMRVGIGMLKKGKLLDLDRITAQHTQIQSSIGNLRKQINQHLDHLEATAREEVKRKFKIREKDINNAIAKLEEQLSKLEESELKLKDGQNESQLFIDMKEAKINEKKRRKLIDHVEMSVGKAALHFKSNNEMMNILKIKMFGTLEEQNSFNSVSHYHDFDAKTLGDKKTCDITGACQIVNGNIAITDKENEKLKLLDSSYKVIAEHKLPGRPRNVCRTRLTEVAIVMAQNEIVQFAEVTDKISLKGSFRVGEACRGIAYNEGLLYIGCGGNKNRNECPGQVRVYDMAEKLLQTFMKDKHKKKMFSLPSEIVVSECKTMLQITDRDTGIVTMKLDGTGPWKFNNPSIKFSMGICIVNNEDLVVSGFVSDNVILFNKNGQQKAILLKKEDGVECPWSVLSDRLSSRLIVSMSKKNHIKVYTLM